jgi:hypothetical protein
VEDQGALCSCTAQALVGAMSISRTKTTSRSGSQQTLHLYNERALIGTIRWDSGATLRDGIKTLAKQVLHRKTLAA